MKHQPKAKAELLAEAKILEEMRGEWTLAHAAAFCNRSSAYLARSECPKHRRLQQGGVKGKTSVVCLPAEVRAWWAKQDADPINAREVA